MNPTLIFFCFIILCSCKKKKCSDSEASSDAIYTFIRSADSCDAFTNGGFMKGFSSEGNTVSVYAEIKRPGNWSITSPIVNGIRLSGSGSVSSNPTTQRLLLKAEGIPANQGSYEIPLEAGCSNCSFKFKVDTAVSCSNLENNSITVYGVKTMYSSDGIDKWSYHNLFPVRTMPEGYANFYFSGTTNNNNDWPPIGKYEMVDQLLKVGPYKVMTEIAYAGVPLSGGELYVARNGNGKTNISFCNVVFTYTDSAGTHNRLVSAKLTQR